MALAQRACISRSLLSRIERGLVSASIETLGRIAGGLEVAMAQLFSDPDRRIDFSHVPPGRGILLDGVDRAAGHCHELLGHLRSDQLCVEPQLVRLDSTAQPRADAQRAGLEFVHVLRGAVRFRYGTRALSAQAGDSLLFEAGAPHGIEAIIDAPVSYLSLIVTLRE